MTSADEDGARDGQRDPSTLAELRPEQAGERLPAHVLHHDDQLPVAPHHVERRHHVGVMNACRQPGLVDHRRQKLRIVGQVGVKPLDGDRAREPYRAEQPPEVDARHPARRDLVVQRLATDDFVRPRADHRAAPPAGRASDAHRGGD